jgi:NAD(P)-dependent dehydrogenase (short-subunit alcohol dehydrogenase family)
MATARKTAIVTGASQGIGAAATNLFLERGYNVVANSRHINEKNELRRSDALALVEGDIALPATADNIVDTAMRRFGSIDALVNNAGIFISKPFIDYTEDDFRRLSSTNLDGFLHITQRVIRRFLAQKSRGSVVNITASIADRAAGLPEIALPDGANRRFERHRRGGVVSHRGKPGHRRGAPRQWRLACRQMVRGNT